MSRLRHPPDDPRSTEVMAATERINRLADQAPGFVWRERVHLGDDNRIIVNVSLWTSYLALHQYIYRSAHNHYVRRRHQWFEGVTQPSTVLWWLPVARSPPWKTPSPAYATSTPTDPARRPSPSGSASTRRATEIRQPVRTRSATNAGTVSAARLGQGAVTGLFHACQGSITRRPWESAS